MSGSNLIFISDEERIEYSRQPCELCNSSIAGERYVAVEVDEHNNSAKMDICVDCVLKIEG